MSGDVAVAIFLRYFSDYRDQITLKKGSKRPSHLGEMTKHCFYTSEALCAGASCGNVCACKEKVP